MRLEELEEDPRAADPDAYRRRVEDECGDGHTWLWLDEAGLCFRASVSAITGDAAQISGVFTPPARRRQGLARRGLSELCLRVGAARATCLLVNRRPPRAALSRSRFAERSDWHWRSSTHAP